MPSRQDRPRAGSAPAPRSRSDLLGSRLDCSRRVDFGPEAIQGSHPLIVGEVAPAPERTLIVERSVSLGEVKETKTRKVSSVGLLAPLAADLADWRTASRRLTDDQADSPARDTAPEAETRRLPGFRREALLRTRTADSLLTIGVGGFGRLMRHGPRS